MAKLRRYSLPPAGLAALTVIFFLHRGAAFAPASSTGAIRGIYYTTACLSKSAKSMLEGNIASIDVALFGIGDLRTDDHEGLRMSLERSAQSDTARVLPLVILDKESIASIPGAISHTEDTACMIAEAIKDLQAALAKLNLPLHVDIGSDSVLSGLSKVIQPYLGTASIRVHVCDHGVVDNSMEYSPLPHLQQEELPSRCSLVSWNCELRSGPWENLGSLPDTYTEYMEKFSFEPDAPIPVESSLGAASLTLNAYTRCPTEPELNSLIQTALDLDQQQCREERNSGLYRTHWGGLSAASVGESKVTEMLRVFVDECQGRDGEFARVVPTAERNRRSLEHATMIWNLRGDGKKSIPETNNVIAGELLSRYLLAPLMLGTISPRRLWWAVKQAQSPLFESPLRSLVETREWHKLFAAKHLLLASSEGGMKYKYWRWHGFLSRYGEQTVFSGKSQGTKEGILLVHGFGASANQWQKQVDALSAALCTTEGVSDTTIECLVPDLIGFGQSEKPPITYSGFTWESFTGDFIKEVAIDKNGWGSFTIGGNSIGGFVAMCAAANDATTHAEAISGCGAPGTGRCTGAILMNAAGVIQSREDVATIEASVLDPLELRSVAQVIASDGLAPCKPLPRFIARAVGNGLLSYLRPRIQSICVNLYPTKPDAVDDDLCQNILRDSLDPGAINVMISGSKLPTPRTYNEVTAADFGQSNYDLPESQFKGPILVAQGILDPLNDAKGRARQLKTLRKGIHVAELQGGHCPHDEIPEEVASSILTWLEETRHERQAMAVRGLQLEV